MLIVDDRYFTRVESKAVNSIRRANARLKPFDLTVGEIVKTATNYSETGDYSLRQPSIMGVKRYKVVAIYKNIFHCMLLDENYEPKWGESFRKLDYQLGEVIKNSEVFGDSGTETKQS